MKIPVKVEGINKEHNRQEKRSEQMSYPYNNFDNTRVNGTDEYFETEDNQTSACERPDAAAPTQEVNESSERVSDAQGEELDWQTMYIRLKADFENHKRNAKIERDRLAGIGKEAVIDDVLPLVDHMEMAIKAAEEGENQEAILKGIKIVYKQLLCTLEKHGVTRVPSIGETFDPKIHEAIGVAPVPDTPENIVVHEVRPGFIRQGKLIRPASVIVSK